MRAKTIIRRDLIAVVSRRTGLTLAETKIAVNEIIELLAEELERGRVIEMRGFGTFYSKERKPRPARNPRTGEAVPVGKRIAPLFKYAGTLRGRINGKNLTLTS